MFILVLFTEEIKEITEKPSLEIIKNILSAAFLIVLYLIFAAAVCEVFNINIGIFAVLRDGVKYIFTDVILGIYAGLLFLPLVICFHYKADEKLPKAWAVLYLLPILPLFGLSVFL
ncbi:MAG: hypothetical protein LUC97_00795 [Clostridiales bacterium]|nr:hypothetical protein [Clostridiales bacterium]